MLLLNRPFYHSEDKIITPSGIFGKRSFYHSEDKIITPSGIFGKRSDLECSSPVFDKHEYCKNTKSTNHVHVLILSMFCEIFVCRFMFLNTGLVHSRSILVFEMLYNFIFGILYKTVRIQSDCLDRSVYSQVVCTVQ